MKLNIKEAVYAIFSAFKHAFLCTHEDLEVFSVNVNLYIKNISIHLFLQIILALNL